MAIDFLSFMYGLLIGLSVGGVSVAWFTVWRKPRCISTTTGIMRVQCEERKGHDGPHRANNPYGYLPILWNYDGEEIVRMRKVMEE